MKTKILVGVLFCSFMGCANKAPKSNVQANQTLQMKLSIL